jgi:hypothetical protein
MGQGTRFDVGATRHGRKCEPKRRVRRGAISEGDWRIAERHPVRRADSVSHTRAGRFFRKMLKQSASRSCFFGLFGLSGLSGSSDWFFDPNNKTKETD